MPLVYLALTLVDFSLVLPSENVPLILSSFFHRPARFPAATAAKVTVRFPGGCDVNPAAVIRQRMDKSAAGFDREYRGGIPAFGTRQIFYVNSTNSDGSILPISTGLY